MADLQRPSLVERDIDQAITALKKGAHLLKYGRRGKPKFCPFRLSTDETTLIWYYGKDEKQLELRHVSRIIPGQRTSVFQRYPRPQKEYQSFSLIYNDRSLDLICKDKDEAEVWFAGLKALIGRGSCRRQRNESRCENALPESPRGRRITPSNSNQTFPQDQETTQARLEKSPQSRLGKAFADVLSYTAATKTLQLAEPASNLFPSSVNPERPSEVSNERTSGADTIRVSLSSAVSTSSHGSCVEDFDNLGDVFMWGEGLGNGVLGGGLTRLDPLCNPKSDALLPKALESSVVLDVQHVACGRRHAVVVTRQGEVFSWGEEDGGRLGHGVESDIPNPRPIQALGGKPVEAVACGERHTCAVSLSGDLYMWGNGGSTDGPVHWLPKRVAGPIDGLQVSSVACGPWHTAVVTSAGRLFTFGDGTFGALGHGDRCGTWVPREVEGLKGLRTVRAACGVWHTAAVVELRSDSGQLPPPGRALSGKLFTWGDGDRGQLGHGDFEPRLVPEMVSSLASVDFCRVACGNSLTVVLTTSGWVYTMGSTGGCQRGKLPICMRDTIAESFIEEIACGSHHVAVLTSKSEVYTWGRGSNGQLGHGDIEDRNIPTLVESLKDKQVRSVACGSNFTAVICLHKWISTADNSICSGCHSQFNFIRKRHNCYNCGLVFCKACSSHKSFRASLAPSTSKPYRVCDDCFAKLALADTSRVRMGEKDGKGSDLRLSSAESFKSDRNMSLSVKFESGENRVFPLSGQRTSTSSKSPSSPFGSSQNFLSFVLSDWKMIYRSPSPVPGKTLLRSSTPLPLTSEANGEEVRDGSEGLSFEVRSLRAQIECLTSKSQLLEIELETKRQQLKDMTARAADEAEKAKAAKEVIKSLTGQLKEMSEKAPDDQVACSHLEAVEQMISEPNYPSQGSSVTSVTSPKCESSDAANEPPNENGIKAQAQKTKRIVQDEPGVYITLVTLPNGANELRRVRFSRKRFTEEEAEKWWAENGTRVCEQHNITTVE
ncbi:Regulator of chromosome condensation (RCC1) family with FYVE zinc finger domain [Striga hermonthica]|uniref:Regulator of chromosome condensation (RCC1) family with FYVE zinc finger domain n=1 Tax=Striga hermonthica TaxID=68872 RepID=A0A9N7NR89_STRHE|nr:Regulator of chromosome condensation (RCC1) family with FYVE zinc finger domain [Striga hermonthica]